MLKSRKPDPEPPAVDTCTKLLDLEVEDKRKQKNSKPFWLPSRHADNDVPSESNTGSNVNKEKCDSNQKWQCIQILKRIQSCLLSI